MGDLVTIKTGKLDSNAAIDGGKYPFFTCSRETFQTDTWAFDGKYVLLAGNNAAGKFPIKYFEGKFDAYQRTYAIQSKDEGTLLTRYLYYVLKLELEMLRRASTGATTKFLTLPLLKGIKIRVPPINIQESIVEILGSIDDLVVVNNRRINKINRINQILFETIFNSKDKTEQEIHFLQGMGINCEEYKLINLLESEYFSLIKKNISRFEGEKRYLATADVQGLIRNQDIPSYNWTEKPSRAQKQPIINSVWFARMKDSDKIIGVDKFSSYLENEYIFSSGFAGLLATNEKYYPYVLNLILSNQFNQNKNLYCTGSTQKSINNGSLNEIKILDFGPGVVERFCEITAPLVGKLSYLLEKNILLQKLIEELNPPLVSGDLIKS